MSGYSHVMDPPEISVTEAEREAFDAILAAHETNQALKHKPTAPDMLKTAADLMAERGKTYDQPSGERSMGKAVAAFNAITGRNLKESEGWLLMQLVKDVRLYTKPGYHEDSAHDCIAYAALKAEAKQREGV